MTTALQRLYGEEGQIPWLDNLTRDLVIDGGLADLIAGGIRGVTANPTILANAITGSSSYDDQLHRLVRGGCTVEDAYWELVIDDVVAALDLLRPLYEATQGADGFVSLELAPSLAHDAYASVQAARALADRVRRPNFLVKIPATSEGVRAVRAATAAGLSINVTLIFSVGRYGQVLEAFVAGLEDFVVRGGDPASIHSVASLFISRVDSEVGRRLAERGNGVVANLRPTAGVAQAKLAYDRFAWAIVGVDSPAWALGRSGPSGHRRRRRTPRSRTPTTSTSSSDRPRSRRCPSPRSVPSMSAGRWRAASTLTSKGLKRSSPASRPLGLTSSTSGSTSNTRVSPPSTSLSGR